MSERPGGSTRAGSSYWPALDGLRGLAVLAVISVHAFNVPRGGFLGVDLFFTLSGFLITGLLLREWRRLDCISLRLFYLRRALRLLPALVLVVVSYLFLTAVRLAGNGDLSWSAYGPAFEGAIAGVFYFSNLIQAWSGLSPEGIRHLWSLAAEEQFYLLWPPVLVLLLKIRVSRRWIGALLLCAIAFVVAHRTQLTLSGANQHRLFFAPDTRADALLIGCVAALWTVGEETPYLLRNAGVRRSLAGVCLTTMLGMVILTAGAEQRSLFAGLLTVFALASAGLILTAATNDTWLSAFLAPRALAYTGRISYGLYLWHAVLLAGLGLRPFIGIPLTFAVAASSYHVIELPFLRRRRYAQAGRTAVEGVPVAAPV